MRRAHSPTQWINPRCSDAVAGCDGWNVLWLAVAHKYHWPGSADSKTYLSLPRDNNYPSLPCHLASIAFWGEAAEPESQTAVGVCHLPPCLILKFFRSILAHSVQVCVFYFTLAATNMYWVKCVVVISRNSNGFVLPLFNPPFHALPFFPAPVSADSLSSPIIPSKECLLLFWRFPQCKGHAKHTCTFPKATLVCRLSSIKSPHKAALKVCESTAGTLLTWFKVCFLKFVVRNKLTTLALFCSCQYGWGISKGNGTLVDYHLLFPFESLSPPGTVQRVL